MPLTSAYAPPTLRGMIVHPGQPFQFDFILDNGDDTMDGGAMKAESEKLIKYFLTSLTLPEDDLWVNLSPYEADRIIPDEFGRTAMGQVLLEQDYLLKQLTASLMHPEGDLGEEFWERVYAEAQAKYGVIDIPIDTFNKVWIVPEKALVYENVDRAFVVESRLKVMLEEDYLAYRQAGLAMEHNVGAGLAPARNTGGGKPLPYNNSDNISKIIRDIIIPEIEHEVNEGQTFAPLRQVYHSFILASWYKKTLKTSLLNKSYSDRKKVGGLEAEVQDAKKQVYEKYLHAFKTGVYDLIKEEYNPATQEIIPRKYFSGGVLLKEMISLQLDENDASMLFEGAFSRVTSFLHLNSSEWQFREDKSKLRWYEEIISENISIEDLEENFFQMKKIVQESEVSLPYDDFDFDSKIIENYKNATMFFNEILNEPMDSRKFKELFERLNGIIRVNDKNSRIYLNGGFKEEHTEKILNKLFGKRTASRLKKNDNEIFNVVAELFFDLHKIHPFVNGNHRSINFIINYVFLKMGYAPFYLTKENFVEYGNFYKKIRGRYWYSRRSPETLSKIANFFKENVQLNDNASLVSVKRLLEQRIAESNGKITFRDFMDISLYSEDGYYSGGNARIGPSSASPKDVDFMTYAEETNFFGATIGEQIFQMWQNMGSPSSFQIVEMGAGNGAMAKDLLGYVKEIHPDFFAKLRYVIVEIGSGMTKKQRKHLNDTGYPIKLVEGSAVDLPLKNIEGVIISNELPDAFPVHRVKKDEFGKLKEVYVGYQNGKFFEMLGDVSDQGITDYIKALRNIHGSDDVNQTLENKGLVVNLDLLRWQKSIFDSLKRGYVITVDYGFSIGDLPLQGGHIAAMHSDFDFRDSQSDAFKYIYGYPGKVDITSHIDFKFLEKTGDTVGFNLNKIETQAQFFSNIIRNTLPLARSILYSTLNELRELGFYVLVQGKGVPNGNLVGVDGVRGMGELYSQDTFSNKTMLVQDKGGIDLDAEQLDLQIQGTSVDMAMFEKGMNEMDIMDIESGLVPFVYSIKPVADVQGLFQRK